MTRRTLNVDGTISLQSFSYFGQGDADSVLQEELADIEAYNSKARAVWRSLPLEAREQKISEFEAQAKVREEKAAQRVADNATRRIDNPDKNDIRVQEGPIFL